MSRGSCGGVFSACLFKREDPPRPARARTTLRHLKKPQRWPSRRQGLRAAFGTVRLDARTPAMVTRYVVQLALRRRTFRSGKKKIGIHPRPHVALLRSIQTAAVEMGVVARERLCALPLPAKPKKLPDAPCKRRSTSGSRSR
jgi:hypothetical protein